MFDKLETIVEVVNKMLQGTGEDLFDSYYKTVGDDSLMTISREDRVVLHIYREDYRDYFYCDELGSAFYGEESSAAKDLLDSVAEYLSLKVFKVYFHQRVDT